MIRPSHCVCWHSWRGALLTLAILATSCSSTDDQTDASRLGSERFAAEVEAVPTSALDSAVSSDETVAGATVDSVSGDLSQESGSSDGGYAYVSDVGPHRLVVVDVCDLMGALDQGDLAAAGIAYQEGGNSLSGDGSKRTLAGFATDEARDHGLREYYGTPTPLDDFISAALDGTGIFAGESDAVRTRAVAVGTKDQVMVAWAIHELNAAVVKAEEGNVDPADGAPHNWDEAWAFFHGSVPECSPWETGESEGAAFGTVDSNGSALANQAILGAMEEGLDALLVGDIPGAEAALDEVKRNIVITYSQAAIRHATLAEDELAEGDADAADEHQAAGYASWRVIEAMAADAGADVDAVNAILELTNEPGATGSGDDVRAALTPAWDSLGITSEDIGDLS